MCPLHLQADSFFVARKEYWTYSFPFLKPNFVSFWLCWAFVAFL